MQKKFTYPLFFLILLIFIITAAKGIFIPQPGDENVYYYMGKLASEGKVPYKDFFYAHPPLHIYLLALAYYIAGFNIVVLKIMPLFFTLVASFFIFKAAKEKFGEISGVLSAILFLFSYSIMFNSVFSFGIELATMLLVIGFYFSWNRQNYTISGVFFGLAAVTRLLALIPILVIFIFMLFYNKKAFLKLSSIFLAIFLLVNAVFGLISGNYFDQVYKFHLMKNFGGESNFREYIDIIKLNWLLFASALAFIFVKNKKPLQIVAAASAVYLIFLLSLKKIFGFYFIVSFPFLAILGGYAVTELLKAEKLKKKYKIIIFTMIILLFLWNFSSDALFLQKIGFSGFERGNDMKDFVLSNSKKGTLLFGDESIAPLLALMTGKSIALDFVDTNNQVFLSGLVDLRKVLENLKGEDVIFVIRNRQGISVFAEVRGFLSKNCGLMAQFHDKMEGDYIFYRCKPEIT